eukprot:scaffold51558_cov29-Tisochrysis_lutea.AAC.1
MATESMTCGEAVEESQPGHTGAHLTFTDCQYTVQTTEEGRPVSLLHKLQRKPTKTRYLLRERPHSSAPTLPARARSSPSSSPSPPSARPRLSCISTCIIYSVSTCPIQVGSQAR